MQHDPSHSATRFRQYAIYGLTLIGLALFIFGSGKAASQSEDKRYIEGNKRQQHFTTTHAAATQPNPAVQPGEEYGFVADRAAASESSDPALATPPAQHQAESSVAPRHHASPHAADARIESRVKGAKDKLLHPSGQQRAAD